MQKLIDGIHRFQNEVFNAHSTLFAQLAKGQHPQVLFITCSDSRVDPSLITQTDPGDLFILRNAGNIIRKYRADQANFCTGEGATIEYAIKALGVEHIILCGHTHCGAMTGFLNPSSLEGMPLVQSWLSHAEETRKILEENYGSVSEDRKLNILIQENVLVQLEHLRTYPAVAEAIAQGKLQLHAWVYKFETGQIFDYDPDEKQFLPLVPTEKQLRDPLASTH